MVLLTINEVAHGDCLVCYKTIHSLCKTQETILDRILEGSSVIIVKANIKGIRKENGKILIPISQIFPFKKVTSLASLSDYPQLINRNRLVKIKTVKKLVSTNPNNLIRARQQRYDFSCHDD